MESANQVLHWSFANTHVLFPALSLTSFSTFIAASLLVIAICFAERFLTFLSTKEWTPSFVSSRSRLQQALWKSLLYWIVTILRLLYMLCAMSFHLGLLLIIVTSLAVAQFFIELRKDFESDSSSRGSYTSIEQPLLLSSSSTPDPRRPRSKSKPEGIFIHPSNSNIARADAAALQLGLCGPTERVSASSIYQPLNKNDCDGVAPVWQVGAGKGRDAARALLGNSHSLNHQPFDVGSNSDIDSSSDSEM